MSNSARLAYAVGIAPVIFLWRAINWIVMDWGRMLTVAALIAYIYIPFGAAAGNDRTFAMILRLALIFPAIWGAVNVYESMLAGMRGYYVSNDPRSFKPGALTPLHSREWWQHLSWKLFMAYALVYGILGYNLLVGTLAWPKSLALNVGRLVDLVKFTAGSSTVRMVNIGLPPRGIVVIALLGLAAMLLVEALDRMGVLASSRGLIPVKTGEPPASKPVKDTLPAKRKEEDGADSAHEANVPTPLPDRGEEDKPPLTAQEVVAKLKEELVLPDETLRSVAELAVLIADPERFRETWKMDPPKGALLWGPPGTGKTSIARKIAEITGMNLVTLSPAEARGAYVGQSANLIKKAFQQARSSSPAVLFIDEAETVAGNRAKASGDGAGQEHVAAVNQLLQEMEGMRSGRYVFVLAATNHPDLIDPAFRSRLGREVPVGMPTKANRIEILTKLLEPLGEHVAEVDYEELANLTEGFSGRDLRSLVQLAVTRVHSEGRDKIERGDLLNAIKEVQQ